MQNPNIFQIQGDCSSSRCDDDAFRLCGFDGPRKPAHSDAGRQFLASIALRPAVYAQDRGTGIKLFAAQSWYVRDGRGALSAFLLRGDA